MALIIMANRLPYTFASTPEGLRLVDSVGGVATGLRGLQESGGGVWVGWPGDTDGLDAGQRAALDRQLERSRCVPVHLSRAQVRGFYQGFSNGILWPLFHYLVEQVPLNPRHWDEYESVNLRFAEVAARHVTAGDEVWIHDYQLMRAPLHLRRLCPEVRIGFFLHIPFPSYEVFRILPARQPLLEGLLGADLVGFHTASYAEHFETATNRLLGALSLGGGRIEYAGRTAVVGAFPMGIDVSRFEQAACDGVVAVSEPAALAEAGQRLLVGIDRLDYTKGIPRRLLAFERLLTRHPELCQQVTLLQVAVPSRTGVGAYRRFRRQVDALVGRINGKFGTAQWTPVRYLYRGFSQEELLSVYRRADVMLVTPVRDGMNLVAKEFVASRMDGEGVLVLSEFTGAAAELVEAIIINPYDIGSAAEAYYRALTMPARERRARMLALRGRVRSNPVSRWADDFLSALRAAPHLPTAGEPLSPAEAVQAALERCRTAPSVLLLLDYDGTLVPFAPSPELAVPDDALLDLLARLAGRPATAVHLVSGRKREALEAWFGGIGLGLHAEHGSWSRAPDGQRWERHEAVRPVPYDELLALLKHSTAGTPGSLIERKSTGLSWHYRLAPPELARRQAEAIVAEVERRFARDSVDVLRGDKVIEFRPAGVHKGLIVTRLTAEAPPGSLVVILGDDATDEDMFAALPDGGLSVHVGPNPSGAALRLRDFRAAREFLEGILGSPLAG